MLATLRSTDVIKNASIDLQFLAFVASDVNRSLGWNYSEVVLEVNFNSAHIRRDLE
mgnify:CR=1 FL=1